jgi:hypothetical protein
MKKALLVLSVGLLFSCKKNEISTLKSEIAGTWELEKFIGYPFTNPSLPPGNGKIMVLGTDGIFERRQHDTVVFRGTYVLEKRNDCYQRSSNTVFSTNESTPVYYSYIELEEGKLTLSTPNCYVDGGTAYYRRTTRVQK